MIFLLRTIILRRKFDINKTNLQFFTSLIKRANLIKKTSEMHKSLDKRVNIGELYLVKFINFDEMTRSFDTFFNSDTRRKFGLIFLNDVINDVIAQSPVANKYFS